jgi:hypothetical protein
MSISLYLGKTFEGKYCFKKDENFKSFLKICEVGELDWKRELQKKIFDATGDLVNDFCIGNEKESSSKTLSNDVNIKIYKGKNLTKNTLKQNKMEEQKR